MHRFKGQSCQLLKCMAAKGCCSDGEGEAERDAKPASVRETRPPLQGSHGQRKMWRVWAVGAPRTLREGRIVAQASGVGNTAAARRNSWRPGFPGPARHGCSFLRARYRCTPYTLGGMMGPALSLSSSTSSGGAAARRARSCSLHPLSYMCHIRSTAVGIRAQGIGNRD